MFDAYKAHLKQIEDGNRLYDELFAKKNGQKKRKTKYFGALRAAEDIGLMVLFSERGGFMF